MDNRHVLEQTLQSYELANEALIKVWNDLSDDEIRMILAKQQNRLEQIAQRMYHEEKEEERSEVFTNTFMNFERANRYLYDNWDHIPFGERLNLLQKQWNRLEELRKRLVH
ncbi:MAG: hypothetical protein IRZ10_06575 [Thermoflavifilum sp.]|nr:hypothetical protein [Thermoflavifilum sp.]MCL6514069.1 hypothetical protein [Alicyclobacillus sp.]